MTTRRMLICPQDILTYYHDEIKNEERARRIIQAERARRNGLIPLVVEEVAEGKYLLIEQFQYYSALMKVQPDIRVPCLVSRDTSEEERLLHILEICIPLEKGTSWLFKNEHVMRLIQNHNFSVREIARRTDNQASTINRYILDTRIPPHIREQALEMDAKTVLEKVASATVIPDEVKTILYRKAINPKGNALRLTGRKFDYMKELCSAHTFSGILLRDPPRLENYIDKLLSNDLFIREHMRGLGESFFDEGETSVKSDGEDDEEISLH